YLLNLEKKILNDRGDCQKCIFQKAATGKEQKVILVVGATGVGKSTLINGMVNYILGVKWEDKHRFKIIAEETNKTQAESQTSVITAYELGYREGFQVPYNLTIIDTPGFGDTRGIERDNKIIEQIRIFFTTQGSIDSIDAVCFVVQASQSRLTHPPVLAAIEASDVPCTKDGSGIPLHFKFNNSALFANNEAENSNENFDKLFWDMGESSMKKFFSALSKLKNKSLLLTKEVLAERKQLEAAVQGLRVKVNVGLVKLEELRKTNQVLKQNKAKMDANKNFEYKVEVSEGKPVNVNYVLTNCQKCAFTCHDSCAYMNDEDKKKCCAMDSNGYCKVCPNKCLWNLHRNQPYKWVYEKKEIKRTYEELKKSYEEATGEVMTTNKIFQRLQEDYKNVGVIVTKLINQLSKSLARLEEIALRPNPLSTPQYIDLLIQSEEQEVKPGYMERIKSLKEVKEQAVLLQKVAGNEELLPAGV
uniref:AAA+ ATPase domain-containing protein n=1 Tax=Latimeria chalumnae TaxID=7897 RepID=H3AIL5_LATCH